MAERGVPRPRRLLRRPRTRTPSIPARAASTPHTRRRHDAHDSLGSFPQSLSFCSLLPFTPRPPSLPPAIHRLRYPPAPTNPAINPAEESKDSGLGLEWVYLNGDIGAGFASMDSFSESTLGLQKTSSSGPAFGVAAGVRLLFFSLGCACATSSSRASATSGSSTARAPSTSRSATSTGTSAFAAATTSSDRSTRRPHRSRRATPPRASACTASTSAR